MTVVDTDVVVYLFAGADPRDDALEALESIPRARELLQMANPGSGVH